MRCRRAAEAVRSFVMAVQTQITALREDIAGCLMKCTIDGLKRLESA